MSDVSHKNRFRPWVYLLALLEVTALVSGVILISILLREHEMFTAWERAIWGQRTLTKSTLFIAIPLLLLCLTKQRQNDYGLSINQLSWQLQIAGQSLLVVGPASTIFWLLQLISLDYRDWVGAVLLAITYAGMLVLLVVTLKSYGRIRSLLSSYQHRMYLWPVVSWATACLYIPVLKQIGWQLPAVLIHILIATGLGEELLFRGYIQSKLNQVFGRPFSLGGTQWGVGLLVTALLFGAMHAFNASGTIAWAFWTFFAGLVFGFLREKTGGIIAPVIVHSIPLCIRAIMHYT